MDMTEILNVIKNLRDAVEDLSKQVEELQTENAQLKEQLAQMQQENEAMAKESRFYEIAIELASRDIIDLDNYKVAQLKDIYEKYGEDGLRTFIQKDASFSRPVFTQGSDDPVMDLIGQLIK